jgi:hypothetical protein
MKLRTTLVCILGLKTEALILSFPNNNAGKLSSRIFVYFAYTGCYPIKGIEDHQKNEICNY